MTCNCNFFASTWRATQQTENCIHSVQRWKVRALFKFFCELISAHLINSEAFKVEAFFLRSMEHSLVQRMQQFPFEKNNIINKKFKVYVASAWHGLYEVWMCVSWIATHISFPGHAPSPSQLSICTLLLFLYIFFGDAREPSIMTLPFEINNEITRACVYWIYIKVRLVKGDEDKWKRNVALVMDDDMTQ